MSLIAFLEYIKSPFNMLCYIPESVVLRFTSLAGSSKFFRNRKTRGISTLASKSLRGNRKPQKS